MKEGARRSGRGQVTLLAWNPPPACQSPMTGNSSPAHILSGVRALPAALPLDSHVPSFRPRWKQFHPEAIPQSGHSHMGFLTGVRGAGAGGQAVGPGLGVGWANT